MTKISVIFLILSISTFNYEQTASNIRDDPNWVEIWKLRIALQPTTPIIDIKRSPSTRRPTTTRSPLQINPSTSEEAEEESVPSHPQVQGGPLTIVEVCIFASDGTILNSPGIFNDCFGYCQNGKFLTAFIYSRTFMACLNKIKKLRMSKKSRFYYVRNLEFLTIEMGLLFK
ncbi:hypothetical protein PVAND_017287 [Polypedilum vanderplanki]|uniref:Uncharacterized protein n=1 Tax=Polypedilum vanderplanki TaxID=319348 RepID=A0A9J6BI94_POLVA|nr:hypothetical protein PVAND_017287 [Polypedilum vanderplanki]